MIVNSGASASRICPPSGWAAFLIPGARGRATSAPAYPLRSCAVTEAVPSFRTCPAKQKSIFSGVSGGIGKRRMPPSHREKWWGREHGKTFDVQGKNTMKKRKTNEQVVKSIMTFSRRGALIQPFVMAALENYSRMVLAAHQKGELRGGAFGFVDADAWADCGREILEKLEQHGYIAKKEQ